PVPQSCAIPRSPSTDGHLDLVADDPYGVGADADLGVVDPAAVGQVEPPAVPGAGDRLVEDDPVTERGTLVGAGVVDGVVNPGVEEDGDHPPPDLERLPLAFDDLAHAGDGVELVALGRQRSPSRTPSCPCRPPWRPS